MKFSVPILVFFGLVCSSFAVQSLKVRESTKIFVSKDGDASKGELSKGDQVTLLRKGENRTLVKTRTDLKGWVANSSIEFIKGEKGDVYKLSEQEVHGWLDNPSAIYILDESGLSTDALPLSRSFSDEVFELQDRENMERGNDEN